MLAYHDARAAMLSHFHHAMACEAVVCVQLVLQESMGINKQCQSALHVFQACTTSTQGASIFQPALSVQVAAGVTWMGLVCSSNASSAKQARIVVPLGRYQTQPAKCVLVGNQRTFLGPQPWCSAKAVPRAGMAILQMAGKTAQHVQKGSTTQRLGLSTRMHVYSVQLESTIIS